jgi:hypothetical protein
VLMAIPELGEFEVRFELCNDKRSHRRGHRAPICKKIYW